MKQIELIPAVPFEGPDGFSYRPDFLSAEEESALVLRIAALEFSAVVMRGVAAKRRTAHFGLSYEFETFKLGPAPPVPDFLLSLRERVSTLLSKKAEDFAEVLVSEYSPGAGIGWHRDAPPFGIVVGVSLLAPCVMKFRPWPVPAKTAGAPRRAKPLARGLDARSVYVLDGEARSRWQHHIPPIDLLRYSITFRTLRQLKPSP